jgi:tektin-1
MNRGGAATTNLARVNLIAIPPPPERFSQLDWHLSLRERFRLADDQHQLADRIICEAERLVEESAEASIKNKKEVFFFQ